MSNQTISYEEAFPTVERRCTELFKANLLLEAKVEVLTKQRDAALAENEQLVNAATAPTNGPDLAAQPPYEPERA